jgi:hypothetical protein
MINTAIMCVLFLHRYCNGLNLSNVLSEYLLCSPTAFVLIHLPAFSEGNTSRKANESFYTINMHTLAFH